MRQHLSVGGRKSLRNICRVLARLYPELVFAFDAENETEWAEAVWGRYVLNVSRPFKAGVLHEWNPAAPAECGISICVLESANDRATLVADAEVLMELGQRVADATRRNVYWHSSNPEETIFFQPR